jgi:dihydrofolate reductase
MLPLYDVARRTKEVSMRNVTAGLFLSLDGVTESPERWQLPYFNDEMGEAVGAAMAAADAMLLGRVTYQEFASYWPGVSVQEEPFADYMNNTPKYVVSRTLEGPLEWNNSTLIKGNLVEEISRLKRQPGKNIGITGSVTLVQSLLQEDLLDELGLMIHPVIVGSGKRIFEGWGEPKGLTLVDSKTFSTGVVYLTYRPAGKKEEGS